MGVGGEVVWGEEREREREREEGGGREEWEKKIKFRESGYIGNSDF